MVNEPCKSIIAGIVPLQTVTRYREAIAKPSTSPSAEKSLTPHGQSSPESQAPLSETRNPVGPKTKPTPSTYQSNPDDQSPNDVEVMRRARTRLLPSMSSYERSRTLNSIRNEILLEKICPPRLESVPKTHARKRLRSGSLDAGYQTSTSIEPAQARRKSTRLNERPSKRVRSEGTPPELGSTPHPESQALMEDIVPCSPPEKINGKFHRKHCNE